jgi:hypothetical protein
MDGLRHAGWAIAAGGDLRRICAMLGVTIATAQHYTSVLSHPGLASGKEPAAGQAPGAASDPAPG